MPNKNSAPKKGSLKTHPFWIEEVLSAKADSIKKNPPNGWGARRIWRQVETKKGEELLQQFGPPPAERTVSDILAKEWPKLTEEEKNQYHYFRWPESMGRDGLPWEASAAALEFLRYKQDGLVGLTDQWLPPFVRPLGNPFGGEDSRPSIREGSRPSIKEVKLFWRVTQAMPFTQENLTTAERSNHLLIRVFAVQALIFRDAANRAMRFRDQAEFLTRRVEEALAWQHLDDKVVERLMDIFSMRIESILGEIIPIMRGQAEPDVKEDNNG